MSPIEPPPRSACHSAPTNAALRAGCPRPKNESLQWPGDSLVTNSEAAEGDGPQLVSETQGLVVHNVGKSFKKRPVLRDVSVNLHRGEIIGLLGPNGAGKSTSFRMTIGLVRPDEGSVSLLGKECSKLPMYKRARLGMGYLAQEPSIFRRMTV